MEKKIVPFSFIRHRARKKYVLFYAETKFIFDALKWQMSIERVSNFTSHARWHVFSVNEVKSPRTTATGCCSLAI